jgi:CheY-like chemotaxis protein
MQPARVLVVDDSPTLRRIVSNVLTEGGYDVVAAESGPMGLLEARAFSPDLVLLDFTMPGMNGYQFVKALDDDESLAALPVVLMRTRSDPVPESALRALGVVDYVTKPFSPEAILAVVSYSLEKHGAAPRNETTRVTTGFVMPTDPSGAPVDDVRDDDAFLSFDVSGEGALEPSSEDTRSLSELLLADLAQTLSSTLAARGFQQSTELADTVCDDVRARLSSSMLAEIVKRAVGIGSSAAAPALYGALTSVPLPEVLQLLKFQGQTGLLDVIVDEGRFEIAFDGGLITGIRTRDARGSHRGDLVIGRYLVARGVVDRDTIESVAHTGSKQLLGEKLMAIGAIHPDDVRIAVCEQAQDLMYELLRARRGVFAMQHGIEHLPETRVSPGFSVDGLLLEGLRRIDEWSVIEKEVPSFHARFVRVPGASRAGLSDNEACLLDSFDEHAALSVHELVSTTTMRPFDICQVLYRLVVLKRLARIEDGSSLLTPDEAELLFPAHELNLLEREV